MEKSWVRWGVCLLLFVCGGVFSKLAPVVTFKLELGWEAFSAIGTLAAVVLSLYLARSAELKARSENKQRSLLVAARLRPIAGALNADLAALSTWVYFENLDSSEPISDIRDAVKRLRIYLDGIKLQDIERIIAIDIVVASYLSKAVGEVEGLIVSVERESQEWSQISKPLKDYYRSHWGASLISARDSLNMALPSLDFAATKAAPTPDYAEIYGRGEH
ncbi:hypothetical protein ACIGJK_03430 [Pseudomonas iridis]|uniref:hypothetical protein n=1 Tax=Pseudomonas iridis TaxID=2710587 RepID=UPI0037C617D1